MLDKETIIKNLSNQPYDIILLNIHKDKIEDLVYILLNSGFEINYNDILDCENYKCILVLKDNLLGDILNAYLVSSYFNPSLFYDYKIRKLNLEDEYLFRYEIDLLIGKLKDPNDMLKPKKIILE